MDECSDPERVPVAPGRILMKIVRTYSTDQLPALPVEVVQKGQTQETRKVSFLKQPDLK